MSEVTKTTAKVPEDKAPVSKETATKAAETKKPEDKAPVYVFKTKVKHKGIIHKIGQEIDVTGSDLKRLIELKAVELKK